MLPHVSCARRTPAVDENRRETLTVRPGPGAARRGAQDAGFTLKKGTAYDKQYSQIYFMRLSQLRPEVKKAAEQRWPDAPVLSILDVEEGVECSVIGTVFKQMKLKPSVLSEYKDGDPALNALVGDAKFTAADDSVVLEDEGSRMVLEGAGGALPVGDLVSAPPCSRHGVVEGGEGAAG